MDGYTHMSASRWWAALAAAVIAVAMMLAAPEPGDQTPLVEGLKFPKISDITRPILGPIKKVEDGMKSIPKGINSVGDVIKKEITKVEKKVIGEFRAIEKKIVGSFTTVFKHIARGITFLTNIPSCLLWYLLHALGWALYVPIAFFVWMFSLKWLETRVWRYLDQADKLVYGAVGVHPFHFSKEIRNKCYFSNLKNEAPALSAVLSLGADVSIDDGSIDDTTLLGYLVLGVLGGALGWALVASAPAPT